MNKIRENLQNAGLTGNESKIYLELIKKGSLSAHKLSQNTSIDRTLTYTLLNNLIEKGLVNYVIKENKKIFSATDPKNILNPIKEKETQVKQLIKDLNQIRQEESESHEIKVFEGKEGLRNLMNLMLEHKTAFSFGGTGKAYDQIYYLQAKEKEFNYAGSNLKIIFSKKYKNHILTKNKNIQTKFLDVDSEATTTIFGEYVSIHTATEKPLIILIKNKRIAKSYKEHFGKLWELAK